MPDVFRWHCYTAEAALKFFKSCFFPAVPAFSRNPAAKRRCRTGPDPCSSVLHRIEIPLVQQSGERIGICKLLQHVLPAHVLRDHHHTGEPSVFPAAGHHRHHQEGASVAGGVLELEGVVRCFDLGTEVFRREHLGKLGIFAVGQGNILAGDLFPQFPKGAFRRVKIFFFLSCCS